MAALYGHVEIAEVLIRNGADLKSPDHPYVLDFESVQHTRTRVHYLMEHYRNDTLSTTP
jgi:hypothetical protein